MLAVFQQFLAYWGIDFGEKMNSIFIVILLIIITSFVIYFLRIFSKEKVSYHLNEYWESRYSLYNREMDWYVDFKKICDDFKLETFLNMISNGKKGKILELGCGNSSLAVGLHDIGYKNISALDFSITVIEKMKAKHSDKSIKYVHGDYLRLLDYFPINSFDCVIEKAGLDSIATKDSDDVSFLLRKAYEQIYNVLKPGGYFISISNKNMDFWYDNAQKSFVESNRFEIIARHRSTFTIEKNPILMNVYFYCLKCVK